MPKRIKYTKESGFVSDVQSDVIQKLLFTNK